MVVQIQVPATDSQTMNERLRHYTGGCLCGAVRYQASGEPSLMGHCYCSDCRKASGSGFIPFMGFQSTQLRLIGETRPFSSKAASGRDAVRNYCRICGSLIVGGVIGVSQGFTIYAGSLDDPSLFKPTIAIFTRGRPEWALIPPGLTQFEGLPGL
jgi:hypothetical protein